MSYTYDQNGNLHTRTDTRGTATSSYDGLNRIGSKIYSHAGTEATPAAAWCYDGQTYAGGACTGSITAGKKGLLTAAGNSASVTSFDQFDDLGRVKASTQTTEGQSYGFGYTYNLAGGLTQVTYPSGKAIGYSFDKAGRVSGIPGYTSEVQYRAHGALSQMTLGNGLVEKWEYNEDRLQPESIKLGTIGSPSSVLELGLEYCPGGDCTKNNGNVRSQHVQPVSVTQSYGYDGLSRINLFTEGSLSRGYAYDRYGNGWVPSNSGLPMSPLTPLTQNWFDAATNRLVSTGYDGSGNQAQVNPYLMVYDGENRQLTSTQTIGGTPYTTTYGYDGEGRRVKKVLSGGAATVYVYDAAGQLAAEYDSQGSQATSTSYLTADHLGSTRLVTDATGAVVKRHDYLPFGEELFAGTGPRTTGGGYPGSDDGADVRQEFTGKERDWETGLDYFEARYFSGAQGRFTSPDPSMLSSVLGDPQSWNRYSYALNNPLKYIDPNGELWIASGSADNPYSWLDDCTERQTCYTSIAANVGGALWVYGSSNAQDIQKYGSGLIDVKDLSGHHDARFKSVQTLGREEDYLGVSQAAALFNVAAAYGQRYPDDDRLVFTGGSTATGGSALNANGRPIHRSHRNGAQVDLLYMGDAGSPLTGRTAAAKGNVERNEYIMSQFAGQNANLGAVLTGDPARYGLGPISADLQEIHQTHMHFQNTYPPLQEPRIRPGQR